MPRDCSMDFRRASSLARRRAKRIYRLQAEVRDEVQARAICGGLKVAKKPCVPVIPSRTDRLTEARQLLTSRAPEPRHKVTRGVTSSGPAGRALSASH